MIKSVSVRNIALIDKVELELGARLNILSGETGAGKSLIIDSLGFVLGERADRGLIRYGTDHAVVEAVFEDYLTPDVERSSSSTSTDSTSISPSSNPQITRGCWTASAAKTSFPHAIKWGRSTQNTAP